MSRTTHLKELYLLNASLRSFKDSSLGIIQDNKIFFPLSWKAVTFFVCVQ